MAIFRGVGGAGTASDNAFLLEISEASEAAQAAAEQAEQSALAAVNAEVSSATFNTSDGVLTLTKTGGATVTADLDGRFLTSYTETNDLSTAVTWANVPDANITESSVTQHLTAANVTSPLTGGTGISIASNGTITNDSPDQTVTLTGTGATTITGTYPNFTINSANTTYTVGDGGLTTNDFTDADHSKLDGIEANADVTDTVNVTAAGALMTTGGQLTGDITFSGTQTVDGRDISVDGSRLDTIPFNRVTHRKLRGSASLILTTTPQSVSQYENTIHPSTPVKCSRYIDLSMVMQWRYVSSNTNDLQLQFQVIVPSGSPTVTNLGTITKGPFTDYTIGTYEQWFYVSGDYTHLFTDFGRLNKTGTSGATEFTVRSFQYDPSTNRTYVLTEDNPGAFVSSGDTVYWHPYAWESAGTALTEYVEIDERYVSYGSQTINLKFKTAYDDSALTYKIKAKEISSQDSGVIYKTTARLIDVEEV